MRLLILLCQILTISANALPPTHKLHANHHNGTQNLVTWDEHSFFIRNERLFIFSGEFHPFRLPSPGLWLDVFQKIKSMGFNGVSFYTDWGLVEGRRGRVVTDGIWDLQPFFDAAAEAGIYLIARPGPYINAETAAGGLPGWTLRLNSTLRSDSPEYLEATREYLTTMGKIIARAQITNGGPVILVQPENEYSTWPGVDKTDFPMQLNRNVMAFTEKVLRDAGIVVPFIGNDNEGSNGPTGYWAPGTGLGATDIYGIDAYPMRYDCANPSVWPTYRFPRDWQLWHKQVSPSTPFAIPEFQGGSGTGWGPDSVNQDMCNALVNEESVRVLFKNNYSFGVKLLNIYMAYGGTNWGNLGYQGGDSSYDYGAAITEDRHIWREKYSEQKLQANFLKVSPAYLTATPGNASNGTYTSTAELSVTPLLGSSETTNFYVVRHADFTSLEKTVYSILLPTSHGNITIPQLGSSLNLNGRDSKIHVTDYDIGGISLVYCTADILTWAKRTDGKRVLLMYGGLGQTHEFALSLHKERSTFFHPSGVTIRETSSLTTMQWSVKKHRQIVSFPDAGLDVLLLWRNEAYTYWITELPTEAPIGNYSSPSKASAIVKGGYLIRTAKISGSTLWLTGDLNATSGIELIHEPTGTVKSIKFNGEDLHATVNEHGFLQGTALFHAPNLTLPELNRAQWKYIDSLPELSPDYHDTKWTVCNHTSTTNPLLDLSTPTSLYASDYGFHSGSLIYRGHFNALELPASLFLNVSGGNGFAYMVWLDQTLLGSWTGDGANQTHAQTLAVPNTTQTYQPNILTVLIDHMGQDEEAPGTDAIKFPKGILNYTLSNTPQNPMTWKMTGNLGGEEYIDQVRGPRNEGALYAERQGFHLPAASTKGWKMLSPVQDGLDRAGVGFYTTSFDLDLPMGYDVPLAFVFNDGHLTGKTYRVQLFVNGYQFGKYIDNLGPQTEFPVPEGILNHHGSNTVAVTFWVFNEEGGARLGSLKLVSKMPVQSGYFDRNIPSAPQPGWKERVGAY